MPIFARDGALHGALRDPSPAAVGRRFDPPGAEANFLPVVCSPECGELGLGVHSRWIRYEFEDALSPLPLPLHVSGTALTIP